MTPLSAMSFVIVAIAFVMLVAFLVRRSKQNKILKAVSGSVDAIKSGNQMTGTHEGTPYNFQYFPGSRNAPSYFRVFLDCPSSGAFRIVKEGWFDKFAKRIGLAEEVQTGDPEFDEEFYILSNDPDFARISFSEPKERKAVQDIFRLGFTEVKLEDSILEAKWSRFKLKDELDPSFVPQTVSRLISLTRQAHMASSSVSLIDSSDWKAKRLAAFAVPSILLVAGIASWIWGAMEYDPLDDLDLALDSLKYSLPLSLIFLWVAVKFVRGRSTSHREMLVVFLLSLAAFPISGIGFETLLNGILDAAPSTSHETVVVKKYSTRSKNSTNYFVLVNSWREDHKTERLRVSSSAYQRIVPRKTRITAITKPGRFGFEWLVSFHILNLSNVPTSLNRSCFSDSFLFPDSPPKSTLPTPLRSFLIPPAHATAWGNQCRIACRSVICRFTATDNQTPLGTFTLQGVLLSNRLLF